MHLEEIDRELHVLDENLDVVYVFERAQEPLLSRAAYDHMCSWVRTHWNPDSDPDDLWIQAKEAWLSLTPEQQAYLWSVSRQEEQNAQDLCNALLARLADYRGHESVKKAFRDAIRGVPDQFSSS